MFLLGVFDLGFSYTYKQIEAKMQTGRGIKSNPFSYEERQRIAERLGVARRSMRNGRGVLQTEMAELLGVSHSHYSKCESGHNSFSAKFLDRFCECTGVAFDWLLSGEGDMYPAAVGSREAVPPSGVRRVAPAGEEAAVRPPPLTEVLVRRVLETARDPQVVAAAEALAQATGTTYNEAAAMVISRRLAMQR